MCACRQRSTDSIQQRDCTPGWTQNKKHIMMILLLGSCSIKQRWCRCRGKAEHTSLSASTYKRLSFKLLKCCLINVLVTLNISTAGGTFVIVEMAGRLGHRWELLPHTGVDVWAAGRTRRAHVIDDLVCRDLNQREAAPNSKVPQKYNLGDFTLHRKQNGKNFPKAKPDWTTQ